MRRSFGILCVIFTLNLHLALTQLPPRISIPGAVLVGQPKPFRNQRLQDSPPPRARRPHIPHAAPAPIRPVVEEPEEGPPSPLPVSSGSFDDEVSKLGISTLQNAVRQADEEEVRPVAFRPERPIPVLRNDIRDNGAPVQRVLRPEPSVPRHLLRPEIREEPVPVRQPVRQQVRQHVPPQAAPIPIRQHVPQPAPVPVRQQSRGHQQRQPSQYLDDDSDDRPGRTRKPPVQILRKYRTDNADGSITWGFENEDGTFKEETLGVDCITRGKYGYIDPDGVKREYSYETGNKCDEPEPEEDLPPQRPQPQIQGGPRKPQFRPIGTQ